MLNEGSDEYADFWKWCAQNGVVSKRLFLRKDLHESGVELSLHIGEQVRAGSVIATVPYLTTLNAQTIRGDMRPTALPSVRKMSAFLTRRRRMDVVTARALWLASCLACYRRLITRGQALPVAPLLSRRLMPDLPSPFITTNVRRYPAIYANIPEGVNNNSTAEESFLSSLRAQVEAQLRITHAALHFYQQRRAARVSPDVVPSFNELHMAYRTVLRRSILLPVDCVPSSPADLAELFEERPDLDLLPTFVPLVDIIRTPQAAFFSAGLAKGDECIKEKPGGTVVANCALYTCSQSNFVSLGSRRRVIFESVPLSSRCVVVCSTSELKEGDELLLDYG